MEVTVKKLTNYEIMNTAMNYTSGKEGSISEKTIRWMYDAEHSPIRTQMWSIEMTDIPTYVSNHLVRHTVGAVHFVKSMRNTDELVTRYTPVNHLIICNAQSLINVSKERLCSKTDATTTTVWELVIAKIKKSDHIIGDYLIPKCERLGRCPERNSCGRVK